MLESSDKDNKTVIITIIHMVNKLRNGRYKKRPKKKKKKRPKLNF